MFVSNQIGRDEINSKAANLGLLAGVWLYGRDLSEERPSVGGNTFAVKDQLKAAGARWNPAGKCWGFESWDALDAALTALEG